MVTTMKPRSTERRRHRRLEADLTGTCRRLGGRSSPECDVRVLDISQGGARLDTGGVFLTGDVVLLSVDAADLRLTLKGLVVSGSHDGARSARHLARVAFTSMATADRDLLGTLLGRLERTE